MSRTKAIYLHCMDTAGNETDLWEALRTDDGHSITFVAEENHEDILAKHKLVHGQYECYCILMTRNEYEQLCLIAAELVSAKPQPEKNAAVREPYKLKPRKRAVLLSKIRGRKDNEAAELNGLTRYGVEKMLQRLYREFDVNNCAELIHCLRSRNIL